MTLTGKAEALKGDEREKKMIKPLIKVNFCTAPKSGQSPRGCDYQLSPSNSHWWSDAGL